MVRIFGLDIPTGLEDIWAELFQFTDKFTQQNFVLKTAIPTRAKKTSWKGRSLFVRFAPIYDGLTSDQHIAWTSYWLTLPFGSHIGAGGWPGSGFSAFVYVNAPRYRAGLSLLLDPPSVNLLYNGDFSLGADGWDLFDGAAIASGHLTLDGLPNPFNAPNANTSSDHPFEMIDGAIYRFSGHRNTDDDAVPNMFFYNLDSGSTFFSYDIPPGIGTFSIDFTSFRDSANTAMILGSNNAPSTISLSHLSLVRIG